MAISVSVIIVYQAHLDPLHLDFLIDALNAQSDSCFNTFWINQTSDAGFLTQQLKQHAHFPWIIQPTDHPEVGGVRCWELHSPFQAIVSHPAIGAYFTYLHLECLPVSDFIKNIRQILPEIEQTHGRECIYMLQQLRCALEVQELHPRHYQQQLRLSNPKTWFYQEDYYQIRSQIPLAYWERPWTEDAFLMPTDLALRLGLFSAVRRPLYFQDLFDILEWLDRQPYAETIRWLRIPDAVIFHLQHPRLFLEYRRDFLLAASAHPEHFGHLALYRLSGGKLHFQEKREHRREDFSTPTLLAFYQIMRWSRHGTVSLWLEDLAVWHHTHVVLPPEVFSSTVALKEQMLNSLNPELGPLSTPPIRAPLRLPISIVVVYHTQLHPLHLDFLIDALNRQHNPHFNTFWINQSPESTYLQTRLETFARFPFVIQQTAHPEVGGVLCWELHTPFAEILKHPDMGSYFTYLHLECLPAPHLIDRLQDLVPLLEKDLGRDVICMLQQLWTPLSVHDLPAKGYIKALEQSELLTWRNREPYAHMRAQRPEKYWVTPWVEDAFLISRTLADRLAWFKAVTRPLYFQDVFDVLGHMSYRPYMEHVSSVRLPDAVIYHLDHPRQFPEYRQGFLQAVKTRPDLFAHLSLWELAQTDLHYEETRAQRQMFATNATLWKFYESMRFSPQGTSTLWLRDLDAYHYPLPP